MNVDTDTQWAYLEGIRNYILEKKDYLMSQVGNPEKPDGPNKKYYDPRGESTALPLPLPPRSSSPLPC